MSLSKEHYLQQARFWLKGMRQWRWSIMFWGKEGDRKGVLRGMHGYWANRAMFAHYVTKARIAKD